MKKTKEDAQKLLQLMYLPPKKVIAIMVLSNIVVAAITYLVVTANITP